jgi:hypothetical protein
LKGEIKMTSGGMIMRGVSEDGSINDIIIDNLAKCLISQGPEHYMVHEGRAYYLTHYFSDIDTDGYGRIRLVTHAEYYLHAVFFCFGTVGLLMSVYEDTTFTHNASNAIVSVNRNRPLAATMTGVLQEACHTPDGSGNGTAIVENVPVGAGGNAVQRGAGQGRDQNEFILKPDTAYLISAQSLADNNKVNIGIDYYWREANG